jgi:hypothetical protein
MTASRSSCKHPMLASASISFRAWTERFDHWFAAPGTLLMRGEVNTAFFSKPSSKVPGVTKFGDEPPQVRKWAVSPLR